MWTKLLGARAPESRPPESRPPESGLGLARARGLGLHRSWNTGHASNRLSET